MRRNGKTFGVVILLALTAPAFAAPPPNADQSLAPWFNSLKSANGISCCSIADCRNYPVFPSENGYQVLYEGKLLPVPPETISERVDNPTGSYVICIQKDYWEAGVQQGPLVRCFIRAPGT